MFYILSQMQLSNDALTAKKQHNTSASKVGSCALTRHQPLWASFSSSSTLGGIERLSVGPPGGRAGPGWAGPLPSVVTCGQASGTSSQRFWLRRRPAESCRPHTTTFCPPASPRLLETSQDRPTQPTDTDRLQSLMHLQHGRN